MDIEITFSGPEQMIAKLNNLSTTGIENVLTKTAIAIENDAKTYCPVGDTGLLRASITHEVKDDEATIGTNVEYAPYVEIGTGIYSSQGDGRQTPWCYQDAEGEWHYTNGQLPQPYLMPALQGNRSTLYKYLMEELRK